MDWFLNVCLVGKPLTRGTCSIAKEETMTARARRMRRVTRRRAARREHIPPEFRPLVDEFALDSHQRREIWWYILVLLMIDEEQVRPMGEHELAGRLWVTLRTQDGNE